MVLRIVIQEVSLGAWGQDHGVGQDMRQSAFSMSRQRFANQRLEVCATLVAHLHLGAARPGEGCPSKCAPPK